MSENGIRIPGATYRLQLHKDFPFREARKILSYLKDLGVTDVYASPIFQAMPKSTHGYDVVDPNRLSDELGGETGFREVMAEKERLGLGWLQDIVPNHMAYSTRNALLMDVFERGPSSPYYRFFDIAWESDETGTAQVVVPILGRTFANAWKHRELRIGIDDRGLALFYFEHRFPLRPESYGKILMPCEEKAAGDPATHWLFLELLERVNTWKKNPPAPPAEEWRRFKADLCERYTQNTRFREILDEVLGFVNNPLPARAFPFSLKAIAAEQHYLPAWWKTVSDRINYRRFFYINTLIGVCVEEPEVLSALHRFIFEQVKSGAFTGLRIDHIDGLLKPTLYLRELERQCPRVYRVVEKILEEDEPLPADWPIQGTTGYDFCNAVNTLFCDPESEELFTRRWHGLIGGPVDYLRLFYEKKLLILKKYMRGETVNLTALLAKAWPGDPEGRPDTPTLQKALSALLAAFPVYRIYSYSEERREYDRQCIGRAVAEAVRMEAALEGPIRQIGRLLEKRPDDEKPPNEDELCFILRFGQLSGPLMAKGYEDTLLYLYNRLSSLNEVGSFLPRFGADIKTFHRFIRTRAEQQPHTMNATATHDTKRGEDVRARLNVLSDIPHEWFMQVNLWRKINRRLRLRRKDRTIPDANDEYLIYQTMLGAWPFDESEREPFRRRLKAYLVKVIREAKVHSRWIAPDALYEQTVAGFIDGLFDPSRDFLAVFEPFADRIAHYGILNSLSQTLLKLACPGVADIYQGCELWDLSLVDPDNRRPVDYERRRSFLEEIKSEPRDMSRWIEHLLSTRPTGQVKMYLIYKMLQCRRENKPLFDNGSYLPLKTQGRHAGRLVAFARRHGDRFAVAAVPRFLVRLVSPFRLPLGERVWEDTCILLPEDFPTRWSNPLDGQTIESGRELKAADLFAKFPAAFLIRTNR